MRKFTQIIESEVEPDVNALWLHDGEIKYWNAGKWAILVPKYEEEVIPDEEDSKDGEEDPELDDDPSEPDTDDTGDDQQEDDIETT